MRTIRGKRALITGAGSGIGRAVALRLAREGANVVLLDINAEALERVAAEAQALGSKTLTIRCDVSQREQIEAAVAEIMAALDGVDILVNSAGIVYYGVTAHMSAADWERMLAIHLHAAIHFIRLLLPGMISLPEAHIVNIGSMHSYFATRKLAAYCTTKFALLGLSESLRAEYAGTGLGITVVCPGYVSTNLFQSGISGDPKRAVPRPPAWLCTTPEHVAQRTVRAINRNRPMVVVTPLAHVLYYFKRFAPRLLGWILR